METSREVGTKENESEQSQVFRSNMPIMRYDNGDALAQHTWQEIRYYCQL